MLDGGEEGALPMHVNALVIVSSPLSTRALTIIGTGR